MRGTRQYVEDGAERTQLPAERQPFLHLNNKRAIASVCVHHSLKDSARAQTRRDDTHATLPCRIAAVVALAGRCCDEDLAAPARRKLCAQPIARCGAYARNGQCVVQLALLVDTDVDCHRAVLHRFAR
eukprot:scaffold4217_cov27-Tisochrysis_lutea.AAC.2